MTPTARSLQLLRKLGYQTEIVERYTRHGGKPRRHDLFGLMDILAIHPTVSPGILGIQATSGANVSARRTKALANPLLATWLAAGGAFQVWGWRRLRDKAWHVRRLVARPDAQGEIVLLECGEAARDKAKG